MTVIYSKLQCYCKTNYIAMHNHYCLYVLVFIIADTFG